MGMSTATPAAPQAPIVKNPADLTWKQGKAVNYILPTTTFTDPQHEAMTYVAMLADGSDLPSWLTFNPKTRAFTGVPAAGDDFSIVVFATDADGLASFATINVNMIDAPVLQAGATPVSAQTWIQGQAVDITLPDGTFTDPQGQALTYTIRLASGGAIPSWLHVNKTTGELTGTVPATISNMTIVEVATDTSGLAASFTFSVTGVRAPVLTHHVANQTVMQGKAFSLSLASEFLDTLHQKLTYAVTQSDGSSLPDWLSFNATTDVLSGTVSASAAKLGILVTATNTSGISATDKFTLTTIAAPVLNHQASDQTVVSGANNSFKLPSDSFLDPNGQHLTYSAIQGNGAPLPYWLHFNPTTLTFSGTPGVGNLSPAAIAGLSAAEWAKIGPAPITIEVIAHDTSGLMAHESFSIHFTNVPLVGV